VAPASNGGTIKLVGNTMVVVHMLTVVDGRYIGGEVGIEGALFPDIIAGDEVKNAVVVTKRKNLLDKQFDAYFSMRLMLKDLCLAGDMASHWTTPLPGLALGTYLHQIGCHLRESQQDLSAFRAIYRKLAG
jgi:3-hydroxyisobutyrate dehydrogenase/2-hydroxy-3-oxopropionate reductase